MTMIEHRVRERAYYIWEGEGRISGRAHDHWIRAEAEMAAMEVETADMTAAALPAVEAVAPTPTKAKPAGKARTSASKKAEAPKAPVKKASRKGRVEGVALH